MTYQLNLNAKHARTVIAALDLLTRVGIGQLEAVADHTPAPRVDIHGQISGLVRNELNKAKMWLGHPVTGSYGISHEKATPEAKAAWDIACVLQNAVAREEKFFSSAAWCYPPLHHGTEPLPTVTIAAEDKATVDGFTKDANYGLPTQG